MATRPPLALLAIGVGSLALASEVPASAGTSYPASGEVTVVDVRASDLLCGWVSLAGKGVRASFEATLSFDGEDSVKVASADGAFSCALTGHDALTASRPCNFAVGGGSARTTVTCPASSVLGSREGNALRLFARSCSGVLLGCAVEADADVTVAPKS